MMFQCHIYAHHVITAAQYVINQAVLTRAQHVLRVGQLIETLDHLIRVMNVTPHV